MAGARTILHVDMDAFYAAVEQRDRPELKGKPVIVGADPKGGRGRGVVATASYEARAFGVSSAMPISQAWKRCPHGVYLHPDMDKYLAVSRQVMEVLGHFSDCVEPVSIDEAFLDVTGSRALFGPGEAIGAAIKAAVRDELRLTVSVGVATTKLVAKIASDLRKPDGLVVVPPGEEAAFLAPLPISRLWGVGEQTAAALRDYSVVTSRRFRRSCLAAVSASTVRRWSSGHVASMRTRSPTVATRNRSAMSTPSTSTRPTATRSSGRCWRWPME
jgi:DNA polymerase-4